MTAHEIPQEALTAALALLADSGTILACTICHGHWIVPPGGPAVLFHRCMPPNPRGLSPQWSREAWNQEASRQWAERALGANPFTTALEDELADQAYRGEEE